MRDASYHRITTARGSDSAAEVSDPAGTVVISGWVMLPKLDAPFPPPQAERVLVSIRASGARMDDPILAKMPTDVTWRCPVGARWRQTRLR